MKILNFNEFTKIAPKLDGIEKGGIYVREGIKYMIKIMNQDSIIREYIGSNLASFLLPKRAPEAFLVKDGGEIYIASKFLDTFETFEEYFKNNFVVTKEFLKLLQTYRKKNLEFSFNKDINHHEERTTVARFLVHNDEHDRNFGIIKNGNILEAAVVDFSQSLNSSIPSILYSYNDESAQKLFYTPETIGTLQKIANICKEPLFKLIEQLFIDIKSAYNAYNNTQLLENKENEIKKIILNSFKICEKELYLHDFLQHLYSITPWDKKFSFSPLEFSEYIDDILVEIVSNNDPLSFSLLMPYIIHQPNLPHLMKEAFKISIQKGKKEFFNKMLPCMSSEPELMQDILIQLKGKTVTKELPKVNKVELNIFDQFLSSIEEVLELIKYAFDLSIKTAKEIFFDNIVAYMEPASELVQEDTTIFTSGLDEA